MEPHFRNSISTLLVGILFVILLFGLSIVQTPSISVQADWTYPSGFNPHGPYIDQLSFQVYPSEDIAQALLALLAGDVDAYDQPVPHQSVNELESDSAIDVTIGDGCNFQQITFNCQRFPTNISGYRRAIAYAADKGAALQNSRGGLGAVMDNAIPISNSLWTYENQMAAHFYEQNLVAANATLDAAGFIDTPDSPHPGWRYYDVNNNSVWNFGVDVDADGIAIEIMGPAGYCATPPPSKLPMCGEIHSATVFIAGMERCGLKSEVVEMDYNAMISSLSNGNFWAGQFGWAIPPPGTPQLLYDMFYSKSLDNLFFYRYNSTEYDYAVLKMMEAPTYLEARSWAWNCCEILLRDMPMIPVFVIGVAHAYRTDLWEGYVPMAGLQVFGENPWTCRKLHLKDTVGGPFGTYYPVMYRQVLSEGMDFTNVLLTSSWYTDEVMNKIYSRLWQLDPYTWEKAPDLAYHWTREDTVASGDIQAGERYTFYLYENVTWHDGTPFTAEDVKFSYEKLWPKSTYQWDTCANIYRIDVPNDYTVEIYTNHSGFFEFTQSTYHYILPKHIWAPYEPINFTWTPVTPADMTGTGPFQWVTRTIGQSILLSRNPTYHLRLEVPARPPAPNPLLTTLMILGSIGLIIILSQVLILTYLFRRRKHQTRKPI